MAKRPRNSVSIETKLKILEEEDSGKDRKLIWRDFQLPKTTVSTIISNRAKIYAKVAQGKVKKNCKRLRTAKHEDIEEDLGNWFDKVRAENIPLTGGFVQEKAKSLAEEKGIKGFKVSMDGSGVFRGGLG